jgi:hypothetical protein
MQIIFMVYFSQEEGICPVKVKYHVRLSEDERKTLLKINCQGDFNMQTVKKNLIKGVEIEGEFLRSTITDVHLGKLHSILLKPYVTYGDIKNALMEFKAEIIKDLK